MAAWTCPGDKCLHRAQAKMPNAKREQCHAVEGQTLQKCEQIINAKVVLHFNLILHTMCLTKWPHGKSFGNFENAFVMLFGSVKGVSVQKGLPR